MNDDKKKKAKKVPAKHEEKLSLKGSFKELIGITLKAHPANNPVTEKIEKKNI